MQSFYQVFLFIENKEDYDATEILCLSYDVDEYDGRFCVLKNHLHVTVKVYIDKLRHVFDFVGRQYLVASGNSVTNVNNFV